MKKYAMVFNTKELAICISEYLSALDIYKLFNVLSLNKNYNTVINYIYNKLYNIK